MSVRIKRYINSVYYYCYYYYYIIIIIIKFFAEDFISEEQRAWYTGFKAGFICSRCKIDISLAACSNRAKILMLLVSSSFFAGPLTSGILSNLSAFVKVANVAFWKACCKLASRRSAFFLKEFNDCQISELTRVTVISTQFPEGQIWSRGSTIFLVKLFAPTFGCHFSQLCVDRRTFFYPRPGKWQLTPLTCHRGLRRLHDWHFFVYSPQLLHQANFGLRPLMQ